MARLMGVPCSILAANNANDTMHRFISTGIYAEVDSFAHFFLFVLSVFLSQNAVISTLAPAIDSQSPYNLERILFYLTDGSTERVSEWMR